MTRKKRKRRFTWKVRQNSVYVKRCTHTPYVSKIKQAYTFRMSGSNYGLWNYDWQRWNSKDKSRVLDPVEVAETVCNQLIVRSRPQLAKTGNTFPLELQYSESKFRSKFRSFRSRWVRRKCFQAICDNNHNRR